MGILDFFGKDGKPSERKNRINGQVSFSEPTSGNSPQNPVSVFVPTSYDEVEKIIDALRYGKTTVVHLTNLKTETAIRVLDMLSGAIYALGGGVYEMEKNIFMFSPVGVEVFEK